jgi:hypothetical protein
MMSDTTTREIFREKMCGISMRRPRSVPQLLNHCAVGRPHYQAVGDFLDAFYASAPQERALFLQESVPPNAEIDAGFRAYIAGMVEKLARDYRLIVPEWTDDPRFFLDSENADYAGRAKGDWPSEFVRALEADTPEEFARRNVFASRNTLSRA